MKTCTTCIFNSKFPCFLRKTIKDAVVQVKMWLREGDFEGLYRATDRVIASELCENWREDEDTEETKEA